MLSFGVIDVLVGLLPLFWRLISWSTSAAVRAGLLLEPVRAVAVAQVPAGPGLLQSVDAVTLLWLQLLLDVHLGLLLDEADAVIGLHDLLVRRQVRVVLICLQYSVLFVDQKAFHGGISIFFALNGASATPCLLGGEVRAGTCGLWWVTFVTDSVGVVCVVMFVVFASEVAFGLDA